MRGRSVQHISCHALLRGASSARRAECPPPTRPGRVPPPTRPTRPARLAAQAGHVHAMPMPVDASRPSQVAASSGKSVLRSSNPKPNGGRGAAHAILHFCLGLLSAAAHPGSCLANPWRASKQHGIHVMLLVRILYNYLIRFGTFITFDFTRGMREGTRLSSSYFILFGVFGLCVCL